MSATALLTPRMLADRWSTSPGRLANDRSAGRGPSFIRVGSSVRYRLDAIERYENARTVTTLDSVAA